MKTLLKISTTALLLGMLSAQAQIPIVSIDKKGNEIVTMITDEDYQKTTSIQAESFSLIAEDQMTLASVSPHLTLKGIMVGLEVSGTVGIGVYKLGTAINQQFFYEIKK